MELPYAPASEEFMHWLDSLDDDAHDDAIEELSDEEFSTYLNFKYVASIEKHITNLPFTNLDTEDTYLHEEP